jgi:hypothetical protein
MELPRRIPYNPKWWALIAGAVFFGACSAFMAYKAAHNTVGLTINGVVTLEPAGATVFYWIISALAAGFVFLALVEMARRIANPRILEMGTDALLLPYGRFQKQTSRIAYSEIQSVSEVQFSGQKFLYVTAGGLRYTITASLFPDGESYVAVRDFLVSHTTASTLALKRSSAGGSMGS